jgi:hypothetical protein
MLGVHFAVAQDSANKPASKQLLLHCRATVTSVEVSEPTIVHEEGAKPPYYYPQTPLLKLYGGSLVLCGTANKILRSTDGGRTWQKQEIPTSGFQPFQRRDGSFYLLKSGVKASEKRGIFFAGRMTLNRLDELVNENDPSWSKTTISVPQFKAAVADDYKTVQQGPGIAVATELANGTLLALAYGNFVGDDVPINGFAPTKGEAPMYRTYMLSSTDDGENWKYLSTIAYDGETGQESFCEPSLTNFGNGELLVIMRTGRYAPLYQTRSLDGGSTWSEPVSLKTLGLQPKMTLLDNGVLVCSFGWRPMRYIYWEDPNGGYYPAGLADYHKRYKREVGIEDPSAAAGDYVMFSPDKGHTWSQPQKIAEPLTQGYTQIAATDPDSCVVLSYRFVLPGKSQGETLRVWEQDSKDFLRDMKTLYEARRIVVRP